jgi:hypothetical protein
MVLPVVFVHVLDLYLGGKGFGLPPGGSAGPSLTGRIADFIKYLVMVVPTTDREIPA